MVRSMTGFGQASASGAGFRLQVDIRSVNHRYGEVAVRLPREWQPWEDRLKKVVQRGIARGKTDVFVSIERDAETKRTVDIDWKLAESYAEAYKRLSEAFGLTEPIRPADLLAIPGLVVTREHDEADAEQAGDALLACTEEALEKLLRMRETEGGHLAGDVRQRLGELGRMVGRVREAAPAVAGDYRAKLTARLRELLGDDAADESRIIAEAAIVAERSDISEELTRMDSHMLQFEALLDANEPIGRKLDFLVQEMNRETNTIGSKANHASIVAVVVDMKAELEKIREQIQNIE